MRTIERSACGISGLRDVLPVRANEGGRLKPEVHGLVFKQNGGRTLKLDPVA